jgi:hypothetical protein
MVLACTLKLNQFLVNDDFYPVVRLILREKGDAPLSARYQTCERPSGLTSVVRRPAESDNAMAAARVLTTTAASWNREGNGMFRALPRS